MRCTWQLLISVSTRLADHGRASRTLSCLLHNVPWMSLPTVNPEQRRLLGCLHLQGLHRHGTIAPRRPLTPDSCPCTNPVLQLICVRNQEDEKPDMEEWDRVQNSHWSIPMFTTYARGSEQAENTNDWVETWGNIKEPWGSRRKQCVGLRHAWLCRQNRGIPRGDKHNIYVTTTCQRDRGHIISSTANNIGYI